MRILIVSGNPRFDLPHAGKKHIDYFLADADDVEASGRDEADLVYLDRGSPGSGAFGEDGAFDDALALLRKGRAGRPWGVIDPEGALDDPAALFHEGADDYIGPGVLANGVEQGRWKRVLARRGGEAGTAAGATPARRKTDAHAEPFPGWNALRPGEEREFFFFYAAPSNPGMIKSKIGETRFQAFKERFRALFAQALAESSGIAWMQNDSAVIYLIPPSLELARAAVVSAVRVLLSATIVSHERFGLSFPIAMTLAIHKGRSPYQPPGKTGKIISDDVNFIHHLGLKRAEPDRLSATSDAACAIPDEFSDLFVPAGVFEERALRHTRRFAPGRA